jgi:hypothetical protein
MSFSYTPRIKKTWELDPKQLRHRYFIQLGPEGNPVLGMLQQDTHPATGQWLEVGKIYDPLPGRYFVQQTDFNTLVPGLLIQNDTPPGPRWKDIQSHPYFYFVVFDNPVYYLVETDHPVTLGTGESFVDDVVNPVLDSVYPGRNPAKEIRFRLFYSLDSYEQVVADPGIMVPFPTSAAPEGIGYYLTGAGIYINELSSTGTAPAELIMNPVNQPGYYPGYYHFILGILDENNDIREYVFMNAVFNHYRPA